VAMREEQVNIKFNTHQAGRVSGEGSGFCKFPVNGQLFTLPGICLLVGIVAKNRPGEHPYDFNSEEP
jgi:hypothetical protein